MSLTPSDAGDAHVRRARPLARQRILEVLDGCALQVEERASGLVVTNPRRLDQGQVHIAYADGAVCWERVTWEHWGRLEGFGNSANEAEPVIGAARILSVLAPDDIHHLKGNGAGLHANHTDTGARPVPPATAGDTAHVNGFMGKLAGEFEARGLRVQPVQPVNSAPDADAIAVTNPAAPQWGAVHVGHDGRLRFWDSDVGTLDDAGAARILDQVTSVLRGSRPRKGRTEPDDRWTVINGSRLWHLRRQRGLTQQELSDRAGISRWTICALERSRRSRCQNRTAALLAVALEVQLASLCDLTGKHQNEPGAHAQPGGTS
jgi:DNA-binding XRE family transcriptional regulator